MFTLCNDFVYHVIRRPGEILHRIDGGRGLIEPVRRFQTTLRNNDHRFPVHRCTRERMKLRSNTRFRVPARLSQANWDDSRVPVTLCHVCFHCSSDAIDSLLSFFILSLSTLLFLPFYSNGLCLFIKQKKKKNKKQNLWKFINWASQKPHWSSSLFADSLTSLRKFNVQFQETNIPINSPVVRRWHK